MYSNRFIALHCSKEIYKSDIENEGITRLTKAVFICDKEKINLSQVRNTLAIMIYHGIGLDGWKKLIDKKFLKSSKELIIAIAMIDKEKEKRIRDNGLKNYYIAGIAKEKSLDYYKIADLGSIKKVQKIIKLKVDKGLFDVNLEAVDLIEDRFFYKFNKKVNADDNILNDDTVNSISNICYKIANANLDILLKEIEKVGEYNI